MTNLVYGIDPGLATGNAFYDLDTCKPVKMWETGRGVKGFKKPFLEAGALVDHIACENFTLRGSNDFVADLSGVKIIGWLEGQDYCRSFPEPVQHMSLCKLRKNVDKYQDSKITHMMKEAGFLVGAGHTRMALSVAVWYAAKILKHKPTLRMLSGKGS